MPEGWFVPLLRYLIELQRLQHVHQQACAFAYVASWGLLHRLLAVDEQLGAQPVGAALAAHLAVARPQVCASAVAEYYHHVDHRRKVGCPTVTGSVWELQAETWKKGK